MQKTLLQIDLTGRCPDIIAQASDIGYKATRANSMRKALAAIKHTKPDVIVAEFVFAPTYGSQLSNFESLFGMIETHSAKTRLIALIHKEDITHLRKLQTTLRYETLMFPLSWQDLHNVLQSYND